MLSDLLVEMSPSPPSPRKRHIETTQQQQQTSSTNKNPKIARLVANTQTNLARIEELGV